jgi:hypothetical protein
MLRSAFATAGGRARDHPGGICGGQRAEAFVPSQAITPTDVGTTGQPSRAPAPGVSDRHRRAIEDFVRALLCVQKGNQLQEASLDEVCMVAHRAVELGAVGQRREGLEQASLGVAVEVPLARETAPAGEDGQCNYLAVREGGFRAGLPSRWI